MDGRYVLIDVIGEMDPKFLQKHYLRSYPSTMGKFKRYASIAAVYVLMCVSVFLIVPHFISVVPKNEHPGNPPIIVTEGPESDPPSATAPPKTSFNTTETDDTEITAEETDTETELTSEDTVVTEESSAVDTVITVETAAPEDTIITETVVTPENTTTPPPETIPVVPEPIPTDPPHTTEPVTIPHVSSGTTTPVTTTPEIKLPFNEYFSYSSYALVTNVFPADYDAVTVLTGKYMFNRYIEEKMPGFYTNKDEIPSMRENIFNMIYSIPGEYFRNGSILLVPYIAEAKNSEVKFTGITVKNGVASVNFTEVVKNPMEGEKYGYIFFIAVDNSVISSSTSQRLVVKKSYEEHNQADPNSEYFLAYNRPTDKLYFPYSIAGKMPYYYGDHFERLIDDPLSGYSEIELEVFDPYVIDGKLYYTMITEGSTVAVYKPHDTPTYEETIVTKDVYIFAGIRNKSDGNLISLEIVGRHSGGSILHEGKYITLPRYFDQEIHEVVFFTYTLDFYFAQGDYLLSGIPTPYPELYVSTPVVVDVINHIFGDADGNGRVSIADARILLEYLVLWDEVKMNRTIAEEWVRHDMINCRYNMPRIAAVLRYIAGWDTKSLGLTAYDFEECSSVKYYVVENK